MEAEPNVEGRAPSNSDSIATQWDSRFEMIVREYLSWLDVAAPLPPNVPLVQLGIDSMGLVGLLLQLEEDYATSFPDELLTPETFESAASLWTAVKTLSDNQ